MRKIFANKQQKRIAKIELLYLERHEFEIMEIVEIVFFGENMIPLCSVSR